MEKFIVLIDLLCFPGGLDCKESNCNVGDLCLIPALGRFPWTWQPAPVFLPRESHGQRVLGGYSTVHGVAKSRQD